MNKTENIVIRILKGIAYLFLAEILSAFLVLTLALFDAVLVKIIIALCTIIIQLGLLFNWSYNAAIRDRNLIKFHSTEYDRFMPLKMAVGAPIVTYISIIVLFLSKLSAIQDVFNYYLLCNLFVMPAVDAFTAERTIDALSWGGFAGLLFVVLLQPAIISVTYILTVREVDFLQLIMYRKKNEK